MDAREAKGPQVVRDGGNETQNNTFNAAVAKGPSGKYFVDAGAARGVQIGDHNHQTNSFGVASPAPAPDDPQGDG
jgi:hypothetical protein